MTRRFTVVGGGVAGLLAARDLARAGHHVTVLEATDRFGGHVAALEVAGVLVDVGAESFATRGGAVAGLLAELASNDDVAPAVVSPAAGPAWVRSADSRSYPLPAAGVLGIPATPLARDVVRAVGLPTALRAALDAVLPATRGATTIGALVTARMGARITRDLVAPVVRGVYSAEPDDLALAEVSPALAAASATHRRLAVAAASVRAAAPAGSQVAGLRGGMVRLVDLLVADAERCGAELRTDAPVRDLAALEGEVVVAAAGLASPVTQRRTVTVVVAVVTGLRGAPRGSGVLVAPGATDVGARALTHSSAKWAWWREEDRLPADIALVRLSYDGATAPSDEEVRRDVGTLTGVDGVELVDRASRTWDRTIAVGPRGVVGPSDAVVGEGVVGDVVVVGEAAGRTGLAGIVAHTRATVAELLARPAGVPHSATNQPATNQPAVIQPAEPTGGPS